MFETKKRAMTFMTLSVKINNESGVVLPQVCQAAKLRVLKLKLFQISSAFAGVMYPSLECK